ncbi:box C/D snoRNA protein 1 [Hylaeus anthracinus]|uniref:box C/D snoRNA protein 1 n=1 Tax=Hylaeus anthracinus TaxID=313031 RepID=UPI0023B90BE8|nr:box C/D snoRNA protein 1 [Hylaeus anthracinus]XP_054007396.1 box C/D snoRNA protein 1 [Hylaeus anthracinus]
MNPREIVSGISGICWDYLKMATSSCRIEDCEVCGASKAKYTCPKCEVRTCCLQCVNIHKKELECSGIRDKTKFVSLKSFTDLDVLSDYRLLEEVSRSVEQLKSDPSKRYTRQNILPLHLSKLRSAAFKRKVNLEFMPQNFYRHKNNTTFLNWKTNELYWRIEWIFPQAEHTKWTTERALDTTRLSILIEEILDPMKSLRNSNDIEDLNLKMCLNNRLQFYQAAGLSGIKVLLKAEKIRRSESRFYELDITLTLKENLENKTIIEFPTIYVIPKDHSDMYEIIDTDNEDTEHSESKCNNEDIPRKKKRKYNQSNTKIKKPSTVNYFFNSELSESDEEKISDNRQTKHSSNFNIPEYDELVRMER